SERTPIRAAILMSGSGTNAVKILEREQEYESPPYTVVAIFTDNSESKAPEIAKRFGKHFNEINMKKILEAMHADTRNMQARAQYDTLLWMELNDADVDLVILAGYDWVVTPQICENFVTVNVHPGDLRTRDWNGKRKYVGLGWVPSAKAILTGEPNLHTSTHLVTPELDGGPLLMVSEPVKVDTYGIPRDKLLPEDMTLGQLMKERRKNGLKNIPETLLEQIAREHQELLKVHGDWEVFPKTTECLATGRFKRDETGLVYFDDKPIPNGLEYRRD
ncbi:MAG: hypothetical protein KJ574_00860, partial [Nanoarchaeota archaeon]|nr:hypothetical protein [Nanoarchaeota archaeon]